ncbi:MAG: hypothetical protein M5R36_16480 [Deltaproteobacteria bacterium]|nr:hypothetical protein [Deltaproteobacteria bacterium]
MMKLRVFLLTCLLLSIVWSNVVWAADDDDDADDDEDEDEEDKWGEAKLDHDLNFAWEYPGEYTKRPLVYSKKVSEFGAEFSYRHAEH